MRPAERCPSLVGPRRFTFLGETRQLAPGEWEPAAEKLWVYNLNYFDDLNACGARARRAWHAALLGDWVRATSPGAGTAWEPYPTSLRIVNWVKWALAGNVLPGECLASLAVQTRWLGARLETHLLGNHLLANAKALMFAGLFFDGSEAAAWLDTGLALLEREIDEQILGDGGHFELSPMYHALALEDLLDLVNLSGVFAGALTGRQALPAAWRKRIASMRAWLAAMCHPDGEIAFFNDAATGVAPTPAELDAYAVRLGLGPGPGTAEGMVHLADSGYVRLASGPSVMLIDAARVGPDYLPGHAHADTLSFELSLGTQRVLVNSGTSRYGTGAERLRQRATAAHNTVVVDGADSSEVWSGFRVARRARPFGLKLPDGALQEIECSHDGYRRLPGRPVHRRVWRVSDGEIQVADHIGGAGARAVAHFHFHPDLQPEPGSTADAGEMCLGDGRRFAWTVLKGGTARLEPSTWHPRFGESRSNLRLVVPLSSGESLVAFRWEIHGS